MFLALTAQVIINDLKNKSLQDNKLLSFIYFHVLLSVPTYNEY
jgi:hypothetical protein